MSAKSLSSSATFSTTLSDISNSSIVWQTRIYTTPVYLFGSSRSTKFVSFTEAQNQWRYSSTSDSFNLDQAENSGSVSCFEMRTAESGEFTDDAVSPPASPPQASPEAAASDSNSGDAAPKSSRR
ncbi:hypothetical protein MMC28_011683 [Mycoblastus sanguinarius]|nr:hypothetical protein [Mycoblastus sanguinarius]